MAVYCEEHTRYDAKVFLEFLKSTLKQYPERKIVMTLDNAKIHHVKLVQPFLTKMKDRIELMYLPPYSPKLNLNVETLVQLIYYNFINNIFHIIPSFSLI